LDVDIVACIPFGLHKELFRPPTMSTTDIEKDADKRTSSDVQCHRNAEAIDPAMEKRVVRK
jgi:hypothetical protein